MSWRAYETLCFLPQYCVCLVKPAFPKCPKYRPVGPVQMLLYRTTCTYVGSRLTDVWHLFNRVLVARQDDKRAGRCCCVVFAFRHLTVNTVTFDTPLMLYRSYQGGVRDEADFDR